MQAPIDSTNGGQPQKRKYCRGSVTIGAEIRPVGGTKLRVQILDLSQTGFRIECFTYLSDGNAVFLTIPNFQQLESRIIWHTEWMYGCQFIQPLHASIYDHIVRTFPVLGVDQTKSLDGIVYGASAGSNWGAQR